MSANPDAPSMRNQLNAAARAVSETLNQLIDACSSAAPGQKECDNAVRRIQSLKPLLDNPCEPINNSSYFDCQQIVVDRSKLLGKAPLIIFRCFFDVNFCSCHKFYMHT